jgi:hypothetical protein
MARHLIVGIVIAVFSASCERALAGGSGDMDSTAVDSTASVPAARADSTATVPVVRAASIPTRADSVAFQSVSRRVKPDASARVLSRRGTVDVHGRDMRLQGVHRYGQPDSTLPWADVTQVQTRGSAAGRGAIVGAVLFGGLGMIAMASSTDPCDEAFEIDCGANTGDVIAGTVGSAAIGALVGTVVAAPFRRWKDVDLDSPKGSTFNDSRRGFMLELGVGPGWTSAPEELVPNARNTNFAGFTRFRLGLGLSERWTLAYVNDVAWNDETTGITGVGLSMFTASGAPSWTLDLAGGLAAREDLQSDGAVWGAGVQAGLGYEFSRHWLMRATFLYASFDGVNRNIIGTSIGKLWY